MKIGRFRPDLAQSALLLANLIPVFGVLYMDWDVGSIVVLYWAENLVVGTYTLLKMLIAGKLHALPLMLFFILHYGGFCAIHGLFVLKLTGFAGEPAAQVYNWPGPLVLVGMFIDLSQQVLAAAPRQFLWACLALLVSHSASFLLLFIGQREYRQYSVRQLMNAPYKRVAVLHMAVLAGGFLVQTAGSPLGLLLALVALKTFMDIMLHNRSHAATRIADPDSTATRQPTGERPWK